MMVIHANFAKWVCVYSGSFFFLLPLRSFVLQGVLSAWGLFSLVMLKTFGELQGLFFWTIFFFWNSFRIVENLCDRIVKVDD